MNARNQQTEYVIKNKGGEQTSCPWIVKPLILRGEMRSQRKWLAKPPNNTFFYGRKDEICRKIKWNFCMKITLKFVFHHLLLFQRQRKFQTPLIPLQNLDHWWNVEKYDENVVVKHISTSSESDYYIGESREYFNCSIHFDILTWWKVNSPRFSIISLVVKDVLASTISTVTFKSVFRISVRVLNSHKEWKMEDYKISF